MDMAKCIDECLACHRTCLETSAYCLSKGGAHVAAEHLTVLLDCAEICRTSANFMLRNSKQHAVTCEACASVWEICAASCETMGNDPQMRRCVEACRRCAQSCRAMAKAA